MSEKIRELISEEKVDAVSVRSVNRSAGTMKENRFI